MATKLKIINELFNDTVDTISSNSDNWQDFLRCAAMNYKYSFSDQLLIYAQRPNAVACADFDTWNNVLNRYIKPKCTGIALLTEYNGIPRIRYVWDLYDTRSMYYKSRRKVKIWHVNKIYEKSLTEALENKYGNFENKEKFIDVIYSFVDVLVDNNYPDYYSDFIKNKNNLGYEQLPDETLETNFKDILKKSIAYMLVIRCCSKENRNYTDNDFNIINFFDSLESIIRIGTAISEISEMGIREIYSELKNIRINEINKIYTFDKNKNMNYYDGEKERSAENEQLNLYSDGKLQYTQPHSKGKEGDTTREVFNNAIRILEEQQENRLPNNVDERHIDRTFDGNRNDSTTKSEYDSTTNDEQRESHREIKSNESNGMGKNDEQLEELSRGNSNERINLQLNSENTNDGILFSTNYKYQYKVGDKVYIESDEYEITKIDSFDIELYNPSYPLIGRVMNINVFENKLKENPANEHLKVDYQENGLDFETVTHISDLADNESYTVARVINDTNCVELHYNKGTVWIELGTKNTDNNWENIIEKPEWFSKNLTDKQVLDKLYEIFNDKFQDISNENYYGEYNDEVDLVEHILSVHKIDDMQVAFNSNENISMWDDDNSWEGKEVYDFILDELLVYNDDGTVNLVDSNDLKRLQEYRQKYEDKEQEIKNLLGKKVFIDNVEYSIDDISRDIATLRDNSFQKNGSIPEWKDVELDKVKSLLLEQENIQQEKSKKIPSEKKKKRKSNIDQLSLFTSVDQEMIINEDIIIDDLEKTSENDLENTEHEKLPDNRINYKIIDDNMGSGTPKEKFRNNILAIKTLKKCEEENRYATPEEQEVLSKFVGWGGLSEAFDSNNPNWSNEYKELKDILSDDEYKLALETTLTAFYTPPVVIRSMYKFLENIGLDRGNILEPSCGIGNFIGLLPNNERLKIYGVEKDSLSGRIAKQLYQKATIKIQGFENADYSDSFFDVAIGNVPFADVGVADSRYEKNHFLLHDYFFAKAIDKVRPGGIIAFITSQGTLDKKSENVRRYIAQRADLLGAIRLPNDTFKNARTKITTDIIFLQKRDSITDFVPEWVHLDKNSDGILMNNYFINNPNMVLGKMETVSGPFGDKTECTPLGDNNLEELLNNAIKNIHAEIKHYDYEELEEDDSIEADVNVNNFSYTVIDDKIYYRENSRMYPQKLAVTTSNRVKGLVELRDCTRELINMQLENASDEEITRQQEKLNKLYDTFTKKYDIINSRGNAIAFSNDNSYYLLCSLEILDEDGKLKRKADMFTKRTINPIRKVQNIKNANDALISSLNNKGFVDIDYMCNIYKKSKDEVIKELEGIIFRVPQTEQYVTLDEYLSGNVREKLGDAMYANSIEKVYDLNIEYLKQALPKDLKASEISVRLGTTWIPKKYYQEFMYQLFKTDIYIQDIIKLNYMETTGEWSITSKSIDMRNELVCSTYGTKRAGGYRLLEDALNLRDTKVYDYTVDSDGKKIQTLNSKETAIAQAKQDQIKQAFQDWIWEDPERRKDLETIYNESFNSLVPREYDGTHLIFSGMNPEIKLRQHQLNAVARILYGGNTLLAHEVGAGKTYEMVAAAMESKRLGLCNKSLFVVPNHIIEQFASEFLQLYPSANILVSTKKDFETANRKKFCSRIATGEYDAIIIGHSQFEKIPISFERQTTLIQKQINDLTENINSSKKLGNSFTVKQMMKTKKRLEVKLEKLNKQERKDQNVVTFEQLGVDRLFVDEAHYYKNLFLYTKMNNVSGIATTEAQKSSDLYMKCQYLDEITNGKGVIFATGTPVSNSMVELYTMQRYLQYTTLLSLDLQNFDAWASTFGETVNTIELAPEGTGYRARTRFSQFHNLPELINIFKEVADIQTSDMLNLPVPNAHYETISVKPSDIQQKMVEELSKRAEKIRSKNVKPNEDNMLKITNDGRKLSLDQRLINELLPENPNGKTVVAAQNIYRIWEENKNTKATQLVFCDLSTPKNDGSFNVYDDLKNKLVEKGIPENEIEYIHNAKTDVQKQEMFKKVRQGKIRILLGSTLKMGAGTNCQDKLIAIHHLDCPWLPSWFTQRDGRGIRQGNQNKDVYIYKYITEKTFDAYLYQIVEQKQKFISQIMSSKTPLRSANDVDETVLSYAEIKALAAGNPLIIEKTDLEYKISKLKLLKQNFLSQIYEMQDKVVKFYPQRIKLLQNNIQSIEKDIEMLKTQTSLYMELNGVNYTDKKQAGEELLNIIKHNQSIDDEIYIGNYRGFQMHLNFESITKKYHLILKNNHHYSVELGSDVFGNITRIDNEIDRLNSYLDNFKIELDSTEQQFEIAKTEMNKTFPQENELKDLIKQLRKVDKELKIQEKVPEILDTLEEHLSSQVCKNDYER